MQRVQDGAVMGDERSRQSPRFAVPARMRKLEHKQGLVSPGFAGRMFHRLHQRGKNTQIAGMQKELARV